MATAKIAQCVEVYRRIHETYLSGSGFSMDEKWECDELSDLQF